MPIDEFMLTPMISPYETMVKDVDDKGLTGSDVDDLKKAYQRLLDLGQEHSDIATFTGACMQENLYTLLSDSYSRALSQEVAEAKEGAVENYDDAALLKSSVDGLKAAIKQMLEQKEAALIEAAKDPKANLKAESEFAARFAKEQGIGGLDADTIEAAQSKEIDENLAEKPAAYDSTAEVEALDISGDLIPGIEALIALGEQEGMTLPNFLRIQIEKGLDKAMEGGVATRGGIEYSIGWSKGSSISPHHIAEKEEELSVFDEIATNQKFGVPNWTELKWATNDVVYKYTMDKAIWDQITRRWDTLLDELSFWATAHCDYAPFIYPWKLYPDSEKPRIILQDKDTTPGLFKERERLLEKYFGIKFTEIFEHPTFKWAIQKNTLGFSEEYVEFLKTRVYPACIPCEHLPEDIVAEQEALYKDKKEINPHRHWPGLRIEKYYDLKFGDGRYLSKFGKIESPDSNAAPWTGEEEV